MSINFHLPAVINIISRHILRGSMAQWLANLEFEVGDPWFDSRVAPLFHWIATLGKLFTHTASAVSQLQETGVQKGVFGA